MGLGTVYIGALRNRPLDVAAELGLPPHVFAAFGLVVGRPDPAVVHAVKPRLPQDVVVLHHETYDLERQDDPVEAYDDVLANFYAAGACPAGGASGSPNGSARSRGSAAGSGCGGPAGAWVPAAVTQGR